MNYGFKYNSPVIGKQQPFTYRNPTSNEYLFSYGRDIYSDLRKFNAPIFAIRKGRGVSCVDGGPFLERKDERQIKNGNQVFISHTSESNVSYPAVNMVENPASNNLRVPSIILAREYIGEAYIYDSFLASEIGKDLSINQETWANTETFDRLIVSQEIFAEKVLDLDVFKELQVVRSNSHPVTLEGNIQVCHDIHEIDINDTSISIGHRIHALADLSAYSIHVGERAGNITIQDAIFLNHPIHQLSKIRMEALRIKEETHHGFINETIVLTNREARMGLTVKTPIIVQGRDPQKMGHLLSNTTLSELRDVDIATLIPGKIMERSTSWKRAEIVEKIKSATANISPRNTLVNRVVICARKDQQNYFITTPLKSFCKYKKKLSRRKMSGTMTRGKVLIGRKNKEWSAFRDSNNLAWPMITEKHGYLDRDSFSIMDQLQPLGKNSSDLLKIQEGINLKRDRYGFRTDDIVSVRYHRENKELGILTQTAAANHRIPFNIEFHDNTIGVLVSNRYATMGYESSMVAKKIYQAYVDNTIRSLEKKKSLSKYSFLDIFCFDEAKKAFLQNCFPVLVNRNIRNVVRGTDLLVAKGVKNGIINTKQQWLEKKKSTEHFVDSLFAYKKEYDLIVAKALEISKLRIDTRYLEYSEMVGNKAYNTNYLNEQWISKRDVKVGYFNNDTMIDRDSYEVFESDNLVHIEKARYSFIPNETTPFAERQRSGFRFDEHDKTAERQRSGINYPDETIVADRERYPVREGIDHILIGRKQYETNPIVEEYRRMEKTVRDLEKNVEKTYNWVYVYNGYEDPIAPNKEYYGIDELLLPEKDVDYSSFEDVIFNKVTMKPKYPVKILDNNTFIAKYPIKHPTPKYEDVGIEYVDVPTDLMYELFLKFYQIWYANIFKFGNMSMIESVRTMLDYMYSHIILNYTGTDYLNEALRVFRLIRWFAESSVMHNAQYKITFEYEDLKSNLHTGSCAIPNDMEGMVVNTSLNVISVKETYFNKDAYIKLYIDNREDSVVTFSISFSQGAAEVYLNDELIDTIYKNSTVATYEVPATGQRNELIIKRPATWNVGFCYIGNIIVTKGAYKNLAITYDPDMRAGNLPLNDVVNKMIQLANMYENEAEVLEQYKKGNLGVSELFKKLQEYWELHHANKEKGKRLTIKET